MRAQAFIGRNRYKMVLQFLCLLLAIGILAHLLSKGFGHVDPKMALWQAQRSWSEGQIIKAIPQFARAVWMAIEAGGRWSIADIYVRRMRVLEKDGRLSEALQACTTAIRILRGYDDEGGLSYECTVIEWRIQRPQQMPLSSPEP